MATTKIITEVTDLNAASSTNGLKMPTGTAYSGTPTDGMVRNDTTGSSQGSASTMQHYNGTEWKNFENFLNGFTADYLVVGGGGGGAVATGAGGAGGYRNSYNSEPSGGGGTSETSLLLSTSTPYTVTVGPGGTGGTTGVRNGTKGSDSQFSNIISEGGGFGAGFVISTAGSGGSGGSASNTSSTPGSGTNVANGDATNQGFNGGNGIGVDPIAGGGGGGASVAGSAATSGNAGAGGAGLSSSITGTSTPRAGGGGGGAETTWNAGAGADGGGSGSSGIVSAGNGVINTGGGGGGTGYISGAPIPAIFGGGGGSGIVILRYPTASVASYQLDASSGLDTVADTAYPVANLAYYKLNGDALDSSGNGYNGTATSVTYAAGRFGQAAVFNGSSSFIDTNAKIPASLDFSVSFWIKTTSASSQLILDNKSGYTTNGWRVFINAGAIVYAEGNGVDNATSQTSPSSTYADGNWHHVCVTRAAGGTVNMYIDNSRVITNGSVGTYYMTSSVWQNNLHIGKYSGGSANYVNGSIDQVRIFNSVLTAANVTSLYNESTVIPSTDGNDSILQFIGGTGTVTFS